MEQILEHLNGTSFIILVIAVTAGLLVFSIIKQLFRIAFFAAALAALYFGYLAWDGQKIPENFSGITGAAKRCTESISGELKNLGLKILDEKLREEKKAR